jgi:uncharacterized protein
MRAGPPPALAVVIHDVARARWRECRALMRCAEAAARAAGVPFLPLTLLVVPALHGQPNPPRFVRWLRLQAARGHELALHGWQHRDDAPPPRGALDWWRRRVLTRSEGEFAALDEPQARQRLERALAWMRSQRLPHAGGFVAPAWRMNAAAWRALDSLGAFDHACTRLDIVALPQRLTLRAPPLVFSTRTRWRRVLSWLFNRWRAARLARAPLLRLELHPGDATFPALRRLWTQMLERALTVEHRQPLRLSQLAAWARAPDRPMGMGLAGRAGSQDPRKASS